jgi:hypothetical protein
MNTIERIIRERAYRLWDHAGRPEGRSEEFWFAAKNEFERNEVTDAPVRRASIGCATAADWRKRRRYPIF